MLTDEQTEQRREYMRRYQAENRERIAANSRRRYEANREEIAAQHRQYYVENRGALMAYQRRYQAENHDKIATRKRLLRVTNREKESERQRRYRETNRDKVAEQKSRWWEANREKALDRQRRYREDMIAIWGVVPNESQTARVKHLAEHASVRGAWSPAEIAYLIKNWDKAIGVVATDLGRTYYSVAGQRAALARTAKPQLTKKDTP